MSPALAAVFDLDGTLVDNMRVHAETWVVISRRLGLDVPAERFEREFAGKKNDEIFPALLGRPLPAAEAHALAAEKEALYREIFAPQLAPIAGVPALLARLRRAGIAAAVATAAPPENRSFVLGGLGLEPYFHAVIGGEHAPRGKPHPDLFLAAAERLGIAPAQCIAFEDAVNGVLAARAAGMRAVGITTSFTAEALREAGADWTLTDYTDLPAGLESALFAA